MNMLINIEILLSCSVVEELLRGSNEHLGKSIARRYHERFNYQDIPDSSNRKIASG